MMYARGDQEDEKIHKAFHKNYYEGIAFKETCLASKDAMPFDLLKKKLMSRLDAMGVRILKVYEEEWSYIPVGGSLPNTDQKNLPFGAAASFVHPATGYSVVRSLSEAPKYASVIASILKKGTCLRSSLTGGSTHNPSVLGECSELHF